MAAMDFPANPTNGQVYGNYVYNSATGAWLANPVTQNTVITSVVAPTNPKAGDLWVNSTDGTMYFYYNDGNTSQWVESRAPIVANGYYSPNYLINGAFDIWQRGTSFAGYSQATYGADRWQAYRGSVTGSTFSRQTAGLSGFQYCMRIQRDSGNTSTASIWTYQSMESVTSIPLAGQIVTWSFYVRAGSNFSSTSNIIQMGIFSGTGTDQNLGGGYTGSTANGQTPKTITTSWQRVSITTTLPSTATEITPFVYFDPTGTAGANDYIEVTGMQLELGSVATPFRRNANSYQGELAACQRYYQRWSQPPLRGVFTSTNLGRAGMPLIVPMRVVPSAAISGTIFVYDGATTPTLSAIVTNYSSAVAAEIDFNTSGGTIVTGRAGVVYQNAGSGYLELNSEI